MNTAVLQPLYDCGSVAVLYRPMEAVPGPGRPPLPDYDTAMTRLAERRGQHVTSWSVDMIGRRSQSWYSLATPPRHHRKSVGLDDSDLSEDGSNLYSFCCC